MIRIALGLAVAGAATLVGLALDRLVRQTLRGAALLLDASASDAAELRRMVTSKGGTTQAAVAVFDEADLKATFGAAVAAATDRSRQLRGPT